MNELNTSATQEFVSEAIPFELESQGEAAQPEAPVEAEAV
jgi:hypothetical protein